jgi:hypothetical protein
LTIVHVALGRVIAKDPIHNDFFFPLGEIPLWAEPGLGLRRRGFGLGQLRETVRLWLRDLRGIMKKLATPIASVSRPSKRNSQRHPARPP